MNNNLVHIEMFSRPDCHLCDKARSALEKTRSKYPFNLRIINIEGNRKLELEYGNDLPVILINGNSAFKHRVDSQLLEEKLRNLWSK